MVHIIHTVINTDVTMALNGRLYVNNSIVTITDVGEDIHSSLLCVTNSSNCCGSEDSNSMLGIWYLPSGIPADGNDQNFDQSRGSSVLRLTRKCGATSPNGIFHCQVPDASGALQNLFVGLYLSNLGE